MARSKKKPNYNSVKEDQDFLKRVSDYYQEIVDGRRYSDKNKSEDEAAFKYVIQTAEEFNVTPLKMRKLLITAGVYSTVTSEIVANLHAEGKSVQEIQAITGLKKSSINGYLPYSKVIYNQSEKSVGADRIGLYRKRNGLISTLQKDLSDEALWDCIIAHQDFLFHTSSGLPFKYSVKVGKNGQYTKELIIDRREESKTLSWSSIVLAFKNAVAFERVVTKPKALGDIRGISYIYPIFYYFGLIQVPEKFKVNMNGKNPKKKGL